MLSTVLEKLETLFSKHMLLGAFYPILVTVFLNLALLHHTSPGFRAWLATRAPSATVETLMSGSVLVFAIAVGAFFLSTIALFLRRLIEGLWPAWLCRKIAPLQRAELDAIETQVTKATEFRRELRELESSLDNGLNKARGKGRTNFATVCVYGQSIKEIIDLRHKREQDQLISAKDLTDAAAELSKVLETNNADLPNSAHAVRLDTDAVDLGEHLVTYATSRAVDDVIAAHLRRQAEFGDQIVEPTAPGNMMRAVSSYAQRRYGFNMDLLWTRLQHAMQGQPFYQTVLGAKAELDSLIALFWLTGVTWVAWWFVLAFIVRSSATFLLVALAGPLVSWALYRLVVASYRSFTDLLRASVDLYRFEVLKGLHLPLPEGPSSERRTWETVALHNAYGEELTLPYEHKAPP
ncbi:MAG TPA: hypothetical protein VFN10_19525 [Thermoanaerobaculia bacterium]|nr:hypothetical protein [Thermoanaerobaculia bacterium]